MWGRLDKICTPHHTSRILADLSQLKDVGISSVTLKIGLFHLLVTDCFMCRVVIVGRYKYKWLRRDSLRVCNKFPLLSYILLTQQKTPIQTKQRRRLSKSIRSSPMLKLFLLHGGFLLEGWRAAITVGTNDGPLTGLSNR